MWVHESLKSGTVKFSWSYGETMTYTSTKTTDLMKYLADILNVYIII